jgi:cytochrome P450
MLTEVLLSAAAWRPPAPLPRTKPFSLLPLLRTIFNNPLEAWTLAHFEQPAVVMRLLGTQLIVINEPSAIRRVLRDNAGNYRKDRLQHRIFANGLEGGLLAAEDQQWRTQRRCLSPIFARKTVMSFAPAMVSAAEALAGRWRDGDKIDAAADMTRLTLDVLSRTIFTTGLGGDPEEFRIAMTDFFNAIGRIDSLDVLGAPAFLPRVSRWKARAARRFFACAIDKLIAGRRRQLAQDAANAPDDILTLLLRAQDPETGQPMSETELRANIVTFISAGHETTANALGWSLYLLSQSPVWRARVAQEVRRESAGPVETLADRLTDTRAVIDKAVRLYPPIAAISREAIEADELCGIAVRPGDIVVIAPYVLHRHRTLWHQPDLFDPGRFLGGGRETIDRDAYLPFGAGPRVCIGAAFALQEATLVLATLIRHATLELIPGHKVWPMLRVTLRPEGGLPMIVRKRSGPSLPISAAARQRGLNEPSNLAAVIGPV